MSERILRRPRKSREAEGRAGIPAERDTGRASLREETGSIIPGPNVVQVSRVNKYGTERIYPVNDDARSFARLCDRKTLHECDLEEIERLGFRVEFVDASKQAGDAE